MRISWLFALLAWVVPGSALAAEDLEKEAVAILAEALAAVPGEKPPGMTPESLFEQIEEDNSFELSEEEREKLEAGEALRGEDERKELLERHQQLEHLASPLGAGFAKALAEESATPRRREAAARLMEGSIQSRLLRHAGMNTQAAKRLLLVLIGGEAGELNAQQQAMLAYKPLDPTKKMPWHFDGQGYGEHEGRRVVLVSPEEVAGGYILGLADGGVVTIAAEDAGEILERAGIGE